MYGHDDSSNNETHPIDSILRYAEFLNFGEIHFKIDHKTGLRAIIAVHNTQRGPAIGGCRLIHYDHADQAVIDALRLAQMMSYKAAVCNLAHGGAKAVLIKPNAIKNHSTYFEAFGDFVNELNGRYITAVDSGTTPADMDLIAHRTPYVTCTTFGGYAGDPSPYTALGVRRGIEAAVKFQLGQDHLEGIHVVIQGAGHVGYYLAKELHALGARLTMTDVNPAALKRCVDEFQVGVVPPAEIFNVACEVFSPCALGNLLTLATIQQLKAAIVAGSANNQLAHHQHGQALFDRNILYAPDFVINSGGLIHAAAIYDHGNADKAHTQIYQLYDTLFQLFIRSRREQHPTNKIAEIIARENLAAANIKMER